MRAGCARPVPCDFVLRGADRSGFEAPGWDGASSLTIDPGLLWSFVGGAATERGYAHIPLNVDSYTRITIGAAFPPIFDGFRGRLDGNGAGRARFNVPSNLPNLPGITVHHAYLVVDGAGNWRMASNPVELRLE